MASTASSASSLPLLKTPVNVLSRQRLQTSQRRSNEPSLFVKSLATCFRNEEPWRVKKKMAGYLEKIPLVPGNNMDMQVRKMLLGHGAIIVENNIAVRSL